MIVIESTGYKEGGDTKLLIWKENLFPEVIEDENKDEAWTVKLLKFPEHDILVWTFYTEEHPIDPWVMGNRVWDISLIQNL